MYFKFIKKVGTAPTMNVTSDYVRANELVQVSPWKDWYENEDGVLVNYFIYTRLHNHDIYCEIDHEFLDMYRNTHLARLLVNVINDELHKHLRFKPKWHHEFNTLDVIKVIEEANGDLTNITKTNLVNIGKWIYRTRMKVGANVDFINEENRYIKDHGDLIISINDFNNFTLHVPTIKQKIDFTIIYWDTEEPITNEATIKNLKRIFDKKREIEKEAEEASASGAAKHGFPKFLTADEKKAIKDVLEPDVDNQNYRVIEHHKKVVPSIYTNADTIDTITTAVK